MGMGTVKKCLDRTKQAGSPMQGRQSCWLRPCLQGSESPEEPHGFEARNTWYPKTPPSRMVRGPRNFHFIL